jgi:hypothetical protein
MELKITHEHSFHGDRFLQEYIASKLTKSEYFIETGSWYGESTAFVAENFTNIRCITCEPDKDRFLKTRQNLSNLSNAFYYNITSPDIFNKLALHDEKMNNKVCTFWLDAHGYGFEWPLLQEISILTHNFKKCYIFIDDFKNPYVTEMRYDQYNNQVCSLPFIENSINNRNQFEVYVPTYTERTSKVHPLVGWAMLTNIKENHTTDKVVKI